VAHKLLKMQQQNFESIEGSESRIDWFKRQETSKKQVALKDWTENLISREKMAQ